MLSAVSTAFRLGRRRTEVLSRIDPVSGARRASIGSGWGHTVGCESQCCPIETQANPIRDAAETTWIASSMIRVAPRSVGLQNGVRWKPIFTWSHRLTLGEERDQEYDRPLRLVAELRVGIAGDRMSDHGERVLRKTVRFGHRSGAGHEPVSDDGHGRHAELLG